MPDAPTDFIDGLTTIAGNGNAAAQSGIAIHVYACNRPMRDRYFYDADGELLMVPQQGGLRIATELGILCVEPGEIALVPRGDAFLRRVERRPMRPPGVTFAKTTARCCDCPSSARSAPTASRIARDFLAPVAAYSEREGSFELVAKFGGRLWRAPIDHSPLDVVAWHGNYAPYKYDLARFNTINTVSFDHPDPSIFTVLTSPSDTAGTANVDFVIFPPRWMVAEGTFRPPWFHRNVMSEYMGLIRGVVRRQGRRLRAGRRQPAQRDVGTWARRGDVRARVAGRARAAEARRHACVHVRKPVRHSSDAASACVAAAAARITRPAGRDLRSTSPASMTCNGNACRG